MHGILGQITTVAEYAAIPNTVAYVRPQYPGPAPVHPLGGTAAQITEINRQFQADTEEFNLTFAADSFLKKQLIEACPDIYLNIHRHRRYSYALSLIHY